MNFEDSTESVTHNKNKNYKYQKNCHTLEFTAKVVLLCSEYGITFRDDYGQTNDNNDIIL